MLTDGQLARLHAAIGAIPPDGWRNDGVETFTDIARQLMDSGLTAGVAVELLESAYDAVAAEFHQTGPATESTGVPTSKDAASLPTGNKVEHAQLMSGGGMHVRWSDPAMDRIFPLDQWIKAQSRFGGRVFRRTIVVVEDWTEVTDRG